MTRGLRNALLRAVAGHDLVALIAGLRRARTTSCRADRGAGRAALPRRAARAWQADGAGIVSGTPVLGVPGYSVAAGHPSICSQAVLARLRASRSPSGSRSPRVSAQDAVEVRDARVLRVRLGRVGEELIAVPLKRGAGAISSLVQAEGLAIVPDMDEGLDPETAVRVELLVPPDEVERTVLAVGSHDIALDLLACHSPRTRGRAPGFGACRQHGRPAGVGATRGAPGGDAPLDPETEEYNVRTSGASCPICRSSSSTSPTARSPDGAARQPEGIEAIRD